MKRVPWEEAITQPSDMPAATDVLMFDEALTRLEAVDSRKARVLETWFFSGMTVEEIADAMEIGTSTPCNVISTSTKPGKPAFVWYNPGHLKLAHRFHHGGDQGRNV